MARLRWPRSSPRSPWARWRARSPPSAYPWATPPEGMFSSWTGPVPILIGVLAVAFSAYLAAVYLAADAARHGDPELAEAYRVRALSAGTAAGALAIVGLIVVHADAHSLYTGLVHGAALAVLIMSLLAGAAALVLVATRRFEPARYVAALAVAAVVAGWAFARYPVLLPGLTVGQAAAPHDTLVAVVIAVLAGGAILFPSLALLFGLLLRGRLGEPATAAPAPTLRRARSPPPLAGARRRREGVHPAPPRFRPGSPSRCSSRRGLPQRRRRRVGPPDRRVLPVRLHGDRVRRDRAPGAGRGFRPALPSGERTGADDGQLPRQPRPDLVPVRPRRDAHRQRLPARAGLARGVAERRGEPGRVEAPPPDRDERRPVRQRARPRAGDAAGRRDSGRAAGAARRGLHPPLRLGPGAARRAGAARHADRA